MAYMGASFRKGCNIPNKTKIEIKKAWLDFYINKDKQTVIGIFISEFEYQEKPQEAPEGFQAVEDDDSCPFYKEVQMLDFGLLQYGLYGSHERYAR